MRNNKLHKNRLRIIFPLVVLIFGFFESMGCTSAIISGDLNPSGRPLLWKHRDTSTTDNIVEYIPAKGDEYSYVALFNAKDKSLAQAWIGMNNVGFAIMNTASYNLKDDKVSKSKMDREGFIMTRALQQCKTVDDFEEMLKTLPRPMGVEANFGVIDALGNGAYFETNNHSYTKYDLKDTENGVLVRTNYSHSGRKGEGSGYVREKNAEMLLQPYIESRSIGPEILTEVLSKSFYHSGYDDDFSIKSNTRVIDNDFIPRFKSTATVVVEGCLPVNDINDVEPDSLIDEYIMWTGMGYPPCSEIIPVWCRQGGVAQELRRNPVTGRSEMCDKVKARRNEVFYTQKGDKNRYIRMEKLYNEEKTGYADILKEKNLSVYETTKRLRDRK